MKKLLSILTILTLVLTVKAQDTIPRTRNATNRDNTYRVLQQKYIHLVDNAGSDTALIAQNAYYTYVTCPVLADSLVINFSDITDCYAGDITEVVATSATGTTLEFIGSHVEYGGTITVTAGHRCNITFIFDGVSWVETARFTH